MRTTCERCSKASQVVIPSLTFTFGEAVELAINYSTDPFVMSLMAGPCHCSGINSALAEQSRHRVVRLPQPGFPAQRHHLARSILWAGIDRNGERQRRPGVNSSRR